MFTYNTELSKNPVLYSPFSTLLLATCHKNTQNDPFSLVESTQIPKITQFVRHKTVFLHQQGDSKKAIGQKTNTLRSVQCDLKKFEETGQVWGKRSDRLENIFEKQQMNSI